MSIKDLEILKGDGKIVETSAEMYEPISKLPHPQRKFKLTDDQKHWYKYYGEILISTNKLALVDLFHLHRLARSIDYYIQSETYIQDKGYIGGLISKTPNDYYQISAHVVIRDKMLKDISDISSHFGFSFLDRKKLQMDNSKQGDQLDLFNQYLKQKEA